ncbi:MAG: hypothetical protein AAGK04_03840 [Planctomycetota bacterium]
MLQRLGSVDGRPACATARPWRFVRILTGLIGLSLLLTPTASAQLFQRATVIQNVRLASGERTGEPTTVIIRGGRIADVGADLEVPRRSDVIDAEGGTLSAPLIDAWSGLGLSPTRGEAGAAAMVHEAFDPYADIAIRDALRNGVGVVYVGAPAGEGVTGVGAVIKLTERPSGGYGSLVQEQAAICVDLRTESAIDRLGVFAGVREAFRGAVDYRETLDVYDEELETYIEELGKLKDDDAEEDKDTEDGDDEPKAAEDKSDGKDEKKDKGPAKPERPRKSIESEMLLKAIDREIPVRVRADRSADILNAIELGEEFNLDIIIEGGVESGPVASRLAAAETPLVLTPASRRVLDPVTGLPQIANIAALDEAGVDWYVGTGSDRSNASRGLLMASQQLSPDGALTRATRGAGRLLRLDGPVGRVGRGATDLVLWSGDPRSPASRVMRVWLDGEVVYAR